MAGAQHVPFGSWGGRVCWGGSAGVAGLWGGNVNFSGAESSPLPLALLLWGPPFVWVWGPAGRGWLVSLPAFALGWPCCSAGTGMVWCEAVLGRGCSQALAGLVPVPQCGFASCDG